MEIDKPPQQEGWRLGRVAHVLARLVGFMPEAAPHYMSNHYRGGAALLDRELYDKPEDSSHVVQFE